MLKGEQLAFRYGADKPWILPGISLHVAPGEIVGLSGPSGLGKTTLGKILAGYLRPNAGSVTVENQPLPLDTYCPVQLIFQHPELAMNPRWRIHRILEESAFPSPALLEALSLDPSWLNRWPHELSGGELQRVAVARTLGPHTRYLIADEMTAMLDANTQAQIWQVVISHARQHHLGVLVISHDAPLLERLCQRVVNMAELHMPHAKPLLCELK
ncbi:MAG: ATP-binding cassette domain-containing protein [Anaerolineales bacterium]|nr:ATP-binding cassette domain-containing protein [Anaerolineales bacterium]